MIDSNTSATTGSLLGPDDPPPVEMVNVDGRSSAVLVCDHASNRVPQRLGTLGVGAADLADHIRWDPGAAEVARRLSEWRITGRPDAAPDLTFSTGQILKAFNQFTPGVSDVF